MVNDTTRLLGLDGLVVEQVEVDVEGVPVVDLSTGCEQACCCPLCGQRAVRVKQWTTTRPPDLPVGGPPGPLVGDRGAGGTSSSISPARGRRHAPFADIR
nr:transposase family protein [Salinispora cortesiana]